MSTTRDLDTAMRYAVSPNSLLFKIVTHSFMERGAHEFKRGFGLSPTGSDAEFCKNCGSGGGWKCYLTLEREMEKSQLLTI